MSNEWRDQLAGARMRVDQQFNDRVRSSQFTNQEWGLIMTAVEFEIHEPGAPERAKLTANTEQLDQIIPELENLPQGMPGASASGGGSGDGLFASIKDALGLSGSSDSSDAAVDEEELAAATALVEEYATELQTHLEKEGRWESVCSAAAGSGE